MRRVSQAATTSSIHEQTEHFAHMYHYQLFGNVLRSELEMPELQQVPSQVPWWTLRCIAASAPAVNGELLGEDVVTGNTLVRMYRHAGGLRLDFDDTGCFVISPDGRQIDWYQPSDVAVKAARTDLTSRVLAAALHLSGSLSLHASAVDLGTSAIGFIAPKRHGKSTLALALVRSGARLLTDDTLPVSMGESVYAHPGLHATRLWEDSAERVAIGTAQDVASGEKRLYSALPEEHVTHDEAPLAALYVLAPTREAKDGEPVWRTRLSPMEAALLLIAHTKLAPLLRGSEAQVVFAAAARMAERLPVYRLNVVRDLNLLPDVVQTIRAWHAPALDSRAVA
jgi:hypothetical protein